MVLFITQPHEVDDALRDAYLRDHPGTDPEYIEKRIERFCDALGIETVSVTQRFLAHRRATGENLHGFDGSGLGHWNGTAHRLAAEILSETIQRHRMGQAPK